MELTNEFMTIAFRIKDLRCGIRILPHVSDEILRAISHKISLTIPIVKQNVNRSIRSQPL